MLTLTVTSPSCLVLLLIKDFLIAEAIIDLREDLVMENIIKIIENHNTFEDTCLIEDRALKTILETAIRVNNSNIQTTNQEVNDQNINNRDKYQSSLGNNSRGSQEIRDIHHQCKEETLKEEETREEEITTSLVLEDLDQVQE